MNKQYDEQALIRNILQGDVSLYRVILKKYQPKITKMAWAFLGSREEAEDAVQEIFIRAFRNLSSFDTTAKFYPWLYSLAKNFLRTKYGKIIRYQEKKEEIEAEADPPHYRTPEENLEEKELIGGIRRSVHRLPGNLRESVILYYFDGLSVSEIAEILDLSEENIKSRLFRARKKLRKDLGKVQPDV